MTRISTLWLAGAAAIASLALSAPASAQRAPTSEPGRAQSDPAPQRPTTGDPAAKREAGTPDAAAGRAAPMTREKMLSTYAEKEAEHRERSAKIERLRALAQADNKPERLAQIADLERQENERYEAMKSRARSLLGDDDFRKADERLNRGRARAQAAPGANAERKAAKDDAKVERHEGQREPAASTERAKPADRPQGDRPKDAGERPKDAGERPKTDAGRAKPADANKPASPPAGERKPRSL